MRLAGLWEAVEALPDGMDTVVGEGFGGVADLSGGQWQRLALARALLQNAPVLLLDEPTSAVDPESEALISAALEQVMAGRTTLIVSHRLSLAHAADRVVVLAGGQIVEQGTPATLLADPHSHFAAMVRANSALILAPEL